MSGCPFLPIDYTHLWNASAPPKAVHGCQGWPILLRVLSLYTALCGVNRYAETKDRKRIIFHSFWRFTTILWGSGLNSCSVFPSHGLLFLTCRWEIYIYLGTINFQHVQHNKCVWWKNCNERKKLNPLTWGGGPLCKDANPNLYWSHALDQLPHFSAPLSLLRGPNLPFFPTPSTHVYV